MECSRNSQSAPSGLPQSKFGRQKQGRLQYIDGENKRRQKSMRGGACRTLLKTLGFTTKSSPLVTSSTPTDVRPLQKLRHLATATKGPPPPAVRDKVHRGAPESRTKRDSAILDMFRSRQLRGPRTDTDREAEDARDGEEPVKVVSCFDQLGLSSEMIAAIGEIGVTAPSEVQCVGIPAVLGGNSLVLIGPSESGRTWAYLLPLIQQLRKDATSFGLKRECPRAIVLCPSEELCDQVFCAAKLISNHARSKSVAGVGLAGESGQKEDSSAAPIGMLVGTPDEILQQMEDGDFVLTDIRNLVLDEADIMLDSDSFPKIHEIFSLLKNRQVEDPAFQTILVASTNEKILGRGVLEHLEQKESGNVAAMMLELDSTEVPGLFKSPDALRKRVTEAVRSVASTSS